MDSRNIGWRLLFTEGDMCSYLKELLLFYIRLSQLGSYCYRLNLSIEGVQQIGRRGEVYHNTKVD